MPVPEYMPPVGVAPETVNPSASMHIEKSGGQLSCGVGFTSTVSGLDTSPVPQAFIAFTDIKAWPLKDGCQYAVIAVPEPDKVAALDGEIIHW